MLKGATTIIDNDFAYLSAIYGAGAPTSTTLTLNGSTANFAATYAIVGNQSTNGPATLSLADGATANVQNLYVGYSANANGSVLVDNSTLNATGFVEVGVNGVGAMTIQDGGKAAITGASGDLYVGAFSGSTGASP